MQPRPSDDPTIRRTGNVLAWLVVACAHVVIVAATVRLVVWIWP